MAQTNSPYGAARFNFRVDWGGDAVAMEESVLSYEGLAGG